MLNLSFFTKTCVPELHSLALFQAHTSVLGKLFAETHMIAIVALFFIILTGMCSTFIYNCTRKLIRDHRIIKVLDFRTCGISFHREQEASYSTKIPLNLVTTEVGYPSKSRRYYFRSKVKKVFGRVICFFCGPRSFSFS